MRKSNWPRRACAVLAFCATTAIASPAQTFRTLFSFNGTNGVQPGFVSLVQGTDGDLYGTTCGGRDGTIFKITASGSPTTLYQFTEDGGTFPNGYCPQAGLVLGTDENFYGTTTAGGPGTSCIYGGCGTVFKITREGLLTTLHTFSLSDGAAPYGALVEGTDGNFYGTTLSGGANNSCSYYYGPGCGTIFKITREGTLTTLHSFDSTDGANPYASLVQGTDGNLYGTTAQGGLNGEGTVFRINPGGGLTTLYSFCSQSGCVDGSNPAAALIQATDGNFYGTTEGGGSSYCGYSSQCGTVFKITPGGTLTTLSIGAASGYAPVAPLIQATDGNFYGTTLYGGTGPNCSAGFGPGCGTVFAITPGRSPFTLHNFDNTDGWMVEGGLFQATNGIIYGTTSLGGAQELGTIFSENLGLGPFVTILPTSRRVGQRVAVLGNNLKGTTSVSFNGTPGTFIVVSSTEIAATVPVGATSGKVQVTTPTRTLSSNVPFRVLP